MRCHATEPLLFASGTASTHIRTIHTLTYIHASMSYKADGLVDVRAGLVPGAAHAAFMTALVRYDHASLPLALLHLPLWFALQTFFFSALAVCGDAPSRVAAALLACWSVVHDVPLGLAHAAFLAASCAAGVSFHALLLFANAWAPLRIVVPAYLWLCTLRFEASLHDKFQGNGPKPAPPCIALLKTFAVPRPLILYPMLLYFNTLSGPLFLSLYLILRATNYRRPLARDVDALLAKWRVAA